MTLQLKIEHLSAFLTIRDQKNNCIYVYIYGLP